VESADAEEISRDHKMAPGSAAAFRGQPGCPGGAFDLVSPGPNHALAGNWFVFFNPGHKWNNCGMEKERPGVHSRDPDFNRDHAYLLGLRISVGLVEAAGKRKNSLIMAIDRLESGKERAEENK